MIQDGGFPRLASQAVVALMKGVVYSDRDMRLWNGVVTHRALVRDYVRAIGLELFLDEAEGYAFLRQIADDETDDGGEDSIPNLIPRRPLGFHLTLLCVLLRKKLLEVDAGGEPPRVILTAKELDEMLRVYFPPRVNEAKTTEEIAALLERAHDYGFLRKIPGETLSYEVRRVIKALFTADWLACVDQKLKEYLAYAQRAA